MQENRPTKTELQKIYDQRYKTQFFIDQYFTGFNGLSSQLVFLVKDDIRNKQVLDVGCGAGRLSLIASLYAGKVDAFDLNPKAIKLAKMMGDCVGSANTNFFVADLENYRSDKKYDLIFYSETIEHVDNPLRSLKNLKKLLKTKGKLVISCPNFQNLRGYSYMSFLSLFKLVMSPSDRREISPHQLEKWCQTAGFKTILFAGALYERGWTDVCVADMIKRLPLAVRDSSLPKKFKTQLNYQDYNQWLIDTADHTRSVIDFLIKQKILKTRPVIVNFKFKNFKYLKDQKLFERIKFYLNDGNNKENLYHCTTYPWNLFGGNNIIIVQNQ